MTQQQVKKPYEPPKITDLTEEQAEPWRSSPPPHIYRPQDGDMIRLLDHGYVKFIEAWGSDERIVESARMSTDKGFRTWFPYSECKRCMTWDINPDQVERPCANDNAHDWRKVPRGDEGLLRYLNKNHHDTPFEFAGMVIEVQAPIFVFREWHRHRTQSYNELSSRYTPLPDLNYVPTVERLMMGGGHLTKQAGSVDGAAELTREMAELERQDLIADYEYLERSYRRALARGVSKELARVRLPVGRYSRMRAQANLRNWLSFLTLRSTLKNMHAQWEIRQYADAVGKFIHGHTPRTWGIFVGDQVAA